MSQKETLKNFQIENATACVLALSEPLDTNLAVANILGSYPVR